MSQVLLVSLFFLFSFGVLCKTFFEVILRQEASPIVVVDGNHGGLMGPGATEDAEKAGHPCTVQDVANCFWFDGRPVTTLTLRSEAPILILRLVLLQG